MAPLTNTWENARTWWQTATPMTRATAAATVLLLVIGLAVAAVLAASPDYTTIYRNVSGKDAAAIETTLHERNIPMVYSDKDMSVSVPSRDESNAIMAVEAAGILSKDTEVVGIESLSSLGMGTSSAVERVHIAQANEGELARKLMGLDPVEKATVSLPQSDDSSFWSSGSTPAATASVILTLRPGQSLDADQIQGIVNLVAHAVPDLSPKDVTLTDQTGTALWKDDGLGGNAVGTNQYLDQDAKFAEMKKKELQQDLDRVCGPGKSLVIVNAELNFDQSQTTRDEHLPSPGLTTSLPISTDEKTTTYTGAGAPPVGGVAGTSGQLNPTSYTSSSGSGSAGAFKESDVRTNYTDTTQHIVTQTAPGGIKKLTVSALVDSSVPAAVAASLQKSLSAAIGVLPGDTTRLVTVQQVPFDNSAEKQAQAQLQTLQSQQLWGSVARAAAVIVVAAVLLFLLTRSGRRGAAPQLALAGDGANIGYLDRSAGTHDAEVAMLEERPLRIEDVLAEMPEVMPSSRPRRRPHAPAIEEQPDLKLESVQEMITASPHAVALLLKGWMYEEARQN